MDGQRVLMTLNAIKAEALLHMKSKAWRRDTRSPDRPPHQHRACRVRDRRKAPEKKQAGMLLSISAARDKRPRRGKTKYIHGLQTTVKCSKQRSYKEDTIQTLLYDPSPSPMHNLKPFSDIGV